MPDLRQRPPADRPDAHAAEASAFHAVFTGIVSGLERQSFVPGQRLLEADLAAQPGPS